MGMEEEHYPYRCSKCGYSEGKLWRQSEHFLTNIRLLCGKCGKRNQQSRIDKSREFYATHGISPTGYLYDHGDQLGDLLPAVPTPDGSFWGYTSVPQEGCEWWKALPCNLKGAKK
jgi:ribosomal protein S27AE